MKKDVLRKKKGPPGKSADKGALKFSDSSTSSSTHKPGGGASLYPVKEVEVLNLDSSESTENKTLDSEEEAELVLLVFLKLPV